MGNTDKTVRTVRIYISDQMTGLTREQWEKNFEQLELKVINEFYEKGYAAVTVFNPAFKVVNTCNGFTYEECLEHDFTLIDLSDAIYMGKNWSKSKGAKRELLYAIAKRKKVYWESTCDFMVEVEKEFLKLSRCLEVC
jgi:hypothetical protein